METSESAVELGEIEEKGNAMGNLYVMFQIREAVSRLQIFVKKDLLKNFANFTRQILRESLFNKAAGLKRSAILLKRDSSVGVFL